MERILYSKIREPKCFTNLIPRLSLYKRLERFTKKVVVFKAGVGSGKTMFLSYYTHQSKDINAWYNLEKIDNDIITFVNYLSNSIHRHLEKFDFQVDKYCSIEDNESLVDVLSYDFLLYLSNFSNSKINIILDDFQTIENGDIYRFLSLLLTNSEDNVRIVIATKEEFPPFLMKSYLNGIVELITYSDLAFNVNEISCLLYDLGNIDDIDECAQTIFQCTEGWAAGVMSVSLQIRQERKRLNKVNIINYCNILQAFECSISGAFRKFTYDIQNFLVYTSLLNELTPLLCNAILDINNSKGILEYLLSQNMFIIKLTGHKDMLVVKRILAEESR